MKYSNRIFRICKNNWFIYYPYSKIPVNDVFSPVLRFYYRLFKNHQLSYCSIFSLRFKGSEPKVILN